MHKQNILLAFALALALGIFIWTPLTGQPLHFLFSLPSAASPQNDQLLAENTRLKNELTLLADVRRELIGSPSGAVDAVVYSRYPFNFKRELLISVGADRGITQNASVFFQGFLIGRIAEVFPRTSLVVTLFDPRWRSAVRIGPRGVEGLMNGGTVPLVTLIEKDAAVTSTDSVYSADESLPYGTPIGAVKSARLSSDRLFQEANLEFPYALGDIRAVSVVRQEQDTE